LSKNVDSKQDQAMLTLVQTGSRLETGLPRWLIDVVGGYADGESAAKVAEDEDSSDCLSAVLSSFYGDRGYVFSWGLLTEIRSGDEDDEDSYFGKNNCYVNFEFCIKELLIAFPNSAMLEDLFSWMYVNHPFANAEFETDESMGDWAVLTFTAHGEQEISRMRSWLVNVFIPVVLPDLMREGLKIVEACKADAIKKSGDSTFSEALAERQRFQLCGDPKDLSF
jgi:hypothetical protein